MTGRQWRTGAFLGKYAGTFVSTGGMDGGQESTVTNTLSTLVHQGIIYVFLGYKTTFPLLGDDSEVRGGSPWSAGTFAVSHISVRLRQLLVTNNRSPVQNADGSRQPTEREISVAVEQGRAFYTHVVKVRFD